MDLTLNTGSFDSWERVFAQRLQREESRDAVIPDTMPDAAVLLSAAGTPLIRSKDVSAGSLRLEVNVPLKLVYRAEESGALCVIELSVPMTVAPEDERITEDCFCTADIRVAALDARLLNPRKLTVRAVLSFDLACWRRTEERFFCAPDTGEHIEALEREAELSPACAVTEKTFLLTDEYPIPQGLPAAAEILGHQTAIEVTELKTVGNKVILRGSARSSLFYRSPEGSPASLAFSSGFSQIIETDTLPEELWVEVQPLLSGVYYEPAEEGRTISAELHLVTQLILRARQRVRYLADAYSNTRSLTLTTETRTLSAIRRELTLRDTLRERAEMPAAVSELLSASARPGALSVSGGEATLPLCVRLVCRGVDGVLFGFEREFPFVLRTELRADERMEIADTVVQELYAAPAAGGVELRLPVELSALIWAEQEIDCVTGVSYDEEETLDLSDQPTLVLLRASDRDDLWSIARENHSAVEAIARLNALPEPPAAWNQLLLIPKTI